MDMISWKSSRIQNYYSKTWEIIHTVYILAMWEHEDIAFSRMQASVIGLPGFVLSFAKSLEAMVYQLKMFGGD